MDPKYRIELYYVIEYQYSIVIDNFIFILLSRRLFFALNDIDVGMQNGILGLKLEKDKVDIIYLSDVQCCWSWNVHVPNLLMAKTLGTNSVVESHISLEIFR